MSTWWNPLTRLWTVRAAVNTFTPRYTHNPHQSPEYPDRHLLFNKLLNKAIDHVYRNNAENHNLLQYFEWAEGARACSLTSKTDLATCRR